MADAYLANRERRSDEVNSARIDSVETQTLRVIEDLRAATGAAQLGSAAKRAFNSELAEALRNELVSLRAQRTALENSETPAGKVISPAAAGQPAGALFAVLAPVGGAIAGLALGCLLALMLERLSGAVRSRAEVEAVGLPVLVDFPEPRRWAGLFHRTNTDGFEAAVRRLRTHVLELEPRPDVITVAPAGGGRSDGLVPEALAESFAKAGHRVVLVRTDAQPVAGGLVMEADGLAEALQHQRLSVLGLLQPSVEPLLSILPSGRLTAQARELLGADRMREVLEPLVEVGHVVVVQSPGVQTVEGEAIVGAADLGLVVVDMGRTHHGDVAAVAGRPWRRGTVVAGVVVGRRVRRQASAISWPRRRTGADGRGIDADSNLEQPVSATR